MKSLATFLMLSFISMATAKSIDNHIENLQAHPGFFDFYWDEKKGQVFLKIEDWQQDFMYVNYLQSGVGSNDIGLDRGQKGNNRIVQFHKLGNKVMLVQPNMTYRALSDNPLERQAVADGFAQSVLWGGEIVAQTGDAVLVNITDFLLRDSHDIAGRLKQMKEGNYQADPKRSAVYMTNSKNFPLNTEFEALITLKGQGAGPHLSSVAPSSEAITVRTHHSFIQLPEEPMTPRAFDPRSGGIPVTFYDYAALLGEPIKKQWVIRHRLEKDDQGQVIEPIIYYLDAGTPEPVRSALLEGAEWWTEAFEKAGFPGGYQVKMLPADADPLDIRYNTIQWVHRSTRGWSYGDSVVDPRSGEILKGHVTLGSLRVRQDMLIAQALLSPFKPGAAPTNAMEQMALARLRQLSAHEVGHTIGLIHNFHASSNDRASVMDYPHPLVQLNGGQVDLSDAYDVGIGAWDQVAIDYLYQSFAPENEADGLSQILAKAAERGLVFIADRDARAQGGSHPRAHLWDNGDNAAQSLLDVMAVRKQALSQFGLNNMAEGEPVASLEKLLAPVYLFHRYQVEAAVKLIAGVDYRYALKGEADVANQMVSAEQQQAAIDAILATVTVDALSLPEDVLNLLLPPVPGSHRDREHFKHRTGLNFDMLAAAEAAAGHTFNLLLHPERINRLHEQNSRNNDIPSIQQLIQQVHKHTWNKRHKSDKLQAIQNSINWVFLQSALKLANNTQLAPHSKAQLNAYLKSAQKQFKKGDAFQKLAADTINQYFSGQWQPTTSPSIKMPPGSPIGTIN